MEGWWRGGGLEGVENENVYCEVIGMDDRFARLKCA